MQNLQVDISESCARRIARRLLISRYMADKRGINGEESLSEKAESCLRRFAEVEESHLCIADGYLAIRDYVQIEPEFACEDDGCWNTTKFKKASTQDENLAIAAGFLLSQDTIRRIETCSEFRL